MAVGTMDFLVCTRTFTVGEPRYLYDYEKREVTMATKRILVRARRMLLDTICPLIGAGIFLAVFGAVEAHAAVFIQAGRF
jgi:hypothetical protein